jgi:CHAT domain-containing protein
MLSALRIFSALCLFPIIGVAQLPQQEIRSETELAYAVYQASSDAQLREDLLRTHGQLVNAQLWTQLSSLAANAYHNRLPQQSLKAYEAAIEVATRLQDSRLLAKSYYNIGITFSGLNQFPKAIESYEKSREYFERAGQRRDLIYILADLGTLHFILEDYEEARAYSQSAIKLAESSKTTDVPPGAWPDDVGRARALQTLAEIDLREGNHSQAIERLQSSLALYQQLNGNGGSYNRYIAGVYAALGKVYPEAGDYARGLFYLRKALEIVRNQSDTNFIASLLNSIGYLYLEQEDFAQAKAHFDQSLKIYRSANNQREESRVLLNLGVIEQRQANYEEALQRFKGSLEAAKATESIDVQIAAGEGIGVVLTAKKEFPGALHSLNESLVIADTTNSKTRQTELLWRNAQMYYEMENYAEAAVNAEGAVSRARAAHLPKLEYLATTTLGQIYAAQAKLELAKLTLEKAVSQLETLRMRVAGRETSSQLYFENKLASYHGLVDILVKQGKPLEALVYAERAKARVLLDVVSGNKLELSKLLTPAEREEQERLNLRLSEINDRIKKEANDNSGSFDSLQGQLDAARLEYQAFQDSVYVRHPDVRIRSGRTTTLSAADLGGLTAKGTAYLEYVVTKERVSLFVISKESPNGGANVAVYPLSINPRELAGKVNQLHDRMANRHPDYSGLARELFELLIEPAKQHLAIATTISIVPDSFLWNLPFQALMTKYNRFLIEDHALYYAPSLSVLLEMKRKPTSQSPNSALMAFGNPVVGKDEQRNEELCPLPEAETEVTSISKFFSPQQRKVLIGREASEKTFRALAPSYLTIHLATHGIIDNSQPLYSHLLLTKSEGDPENDGLLEAREIMNMNLSADLAVLSACETANGRVAPGEGVMGMSWAFFVAGTRSMLVSQWKVNSASTSQLMATFYQQDRANKSMALQQSALRLMKDPRYRHPFYWAAFVLIGRN